VSLVAHGTITTVADADALRLAVDQALRKKEDGDGGDDEPESRPPTHPSLEIAAIQSGKFRDGISGETIREIRDIDSERGDLP
jgi:hypothetical protein